MNDGTRECPFLVRADEIQAGRETFSHPWNDRSELSGTHLSPMTGMKDSGVSWVSVPPGKESFVYHLHQREDEWIYILSGSGTAEINEQEFDVGPGDFMGFPAGEAAHHLRNTGEADLVYLMGGSSRELDVAEFPRLGKVMVRQRDKLRIFDEADERGFD